MLPQGAFLLNTSGGSGSGLYTVDISFSDASKAQFLAPGDKLTDRVGNEYSIANPSGWVGYPSDFSNLGTARVIPITVDTAPTNSLSLGDATVETPNQTDYDPPVQTGGTIISNILLEGRTYKYQVSASWFIGSEANNAQVGDRFIDSAGKVFEITALSGQPNAFSSPFQAVEVDRIGDSPNAGNAYLYRGTPRFGFYQGQLLSQLAEDAVRNRDEYVTDENLGTGSGIAGGGTAVTGVPTTTVASGVTYYEVQDSDYLVLVLDPNPVSIVMPSAPVDGRSIIVKDSSPTNPDRDVNPITIFASGVGNTVDGETNAQMVNTRQSLGFVYEADITDWVII